MGIKSNIQWTDATWNIAVGCKKIDADCKYCYMYRDSLEGTRYNPKIVRKTKTVFNMPMKLKEPSKIFTSSLTDWCLPEIDPFRHEMFEIIRACPQHTFQLLTKRPERLAHVLPLDWGRGYRNCWLGTSVGSDTDQAMQRIHDLCVADAEVKFISVEPLWGRMRDFIPFDYQLTGREPMIDWVIVGGESGNDKGKYRYRDCELAWIEEVVEQCRAAGVPVFVKQLGTFLSKKLGLKDRHGGDISEFPSHLRIRQFPNPLLM